MGGRQAKIFWNQATSIRPDPWRERRESRPPRPPYLPAAVCTQVWAASLHGRGRQTLPEPRRLEGAHAPRGAAVDDEPPTAAVCVACGWASATAAPHLDPHGCVALKGARALANRRGAVKNAIGPRAPVAARAPAGVPCLDAVPVHPPPPAAPPPPHSPPVRRFRGSRPTTPPPHRAGVAKTGPAGCGGRHPSYRLATRRRSPPPPPPSPPPRAARSGVWCQGGGVYRPSSSLRPAQPPASAPFAARRQLASPTSTELWSLPPPPPSIVMRSWDCPFSQAVLPPHRCCQWRVSPLCASLCALLDYVPPAVPQFSPTPSPVHLRTCSPPSVPPTAALATALESTMALAEWLTHCATTPGAGAC